MGRGQRGQEVVLSWCRPWYEHLREYPLSCACAVLALFCVALMPATDFGERLELRTHSLRFRLRGPRESTAKVVIVAVDDATEDVDSPVGWREPVAFWANHYANVIQTARRCGARVIGMDIIPSVRADDYLDAVSADPATRPDTRLAQAIQEAGGSVVLARRLNGDVQPIERFRLLPEADGNIGFVDLPRSPDEVVHRGSLLQPIPGMGSGSEMTLLPSLPGLLAARGSEKKNSADSDADAEAVRRLGRGRLWNGGGLLPLAREPDLLSRSHTGKRTPGAPPQLPDLESFWINYTGTDLPTISAWRLEHPEQMTDEERQLLNGAVVLLGFTFSGGNDWQNVPDGAISATVADVDSAPALLNTRSGARPISGVAIQAQAVATLLDGRPLLRLATWREQLLTLGVGALALALAVGLPFGRGLLFGIGLGTALTAATVLAFARADLLLPLFAPLTALGAPWLVFHAVRSLQENDRRLDESRHRLRIETMFGRYVSPQIRDYILRDPSHSRPGGTLQDATILFLDMRGSTVYGERKDPVLLLSDLNEFFAVIVPVVDGNGGLLYRYTGDGFLAVFGAPTPIPADLHGGDHARAAVAAAADLVHAVTRESARRTKDGMASWRIGCSVHSGPVACGNLGTEDRPDFTVIGDAVNLCAKMEERNKAEDSDIVVSETTLARLRAAAGIVDTTDPATALPPGLPPPFRSKLVRIGKRTEETPLHFFRIDAVDSAVDNAFDSGTYPMAATAPRFATAPTAASGPTPDQETRIP